MHKYFPILKKKFNRLNNSIIVVGGGRWATIIINELLLNFKGLKKIIVVTKNKNIFDNFSNKSKKKLKYESNLSFLKKEDKIKFAIIANKNKNHFSTSKLLIQKKINILVEKPLVETASQYKILLSLSKTNNCKVFVSMPFYFSYYFYFFKQRYIKNKKYNIHFEWHDKINETRKGKLKKHDFSINYLQDTLYHFYGIIACFYGNKKIHHIKSLNKKNEGYLKLKYNNSKLHFNCSRKKTNKRVRLITFESKRKKYVINFSDDNNIKIINDKIKQKLKFNFCQKTLKYQLYYFLNFNKVQGKFLINDINKIKDLIKLKFKLNN